MSKPNHLRPYGKGYADGAAISLRFSQAQLQAIKAAAEKAGYPFRTFIRETVLRAIGASDLGDFDNQ